MSESATFSDGRQAEFRRQLPEHLSEAIRLGKRHATWAKVSLYSGLSESFLEDIAAGHRVPGRRSIDRLRAAGLMLPDETWAELYELARGEAIDALEAMGDTP